MIIGDNASDPRTTVQFGVALVHLVSGEDIIGRVEIDAANGLYLVDRPVVPVMQPKIDKLSGEQTGASLALMPYRFFLDPTEPLIIRDGNVLFVGKLLDQVIKHYAQVTSDITIAGPDSVKDIRG